jgi:chaperone required for assembly of F1-ATPase
LSETKAAPVFAEPSVQTLGAGFGVALDGMALKTPAGTVLRVPTKAFAEALADEWRGVLPRGKFAKFDFEKVPLTRIAGTACDRIAPKRDAVIDEFVAYAETDLVCYRVGEPRDLAARQIATWQPLLDWLALAFDARLEAHMAVAPRPQPASSLAALRKSLHGFDDLKLSGLGVAVGACGSLAIGLALAEGRLDAAGAFAAAELDALFQIERWGPDPVHTAKHAAIRADLVVCERFLALAKA